MTGYGKFCISDYMFNFILCWWYCGSGKFLYSQWCSSLNLKCIYEAFSLELYWWCVCAFGERMTLIFSWTSIAALLRKLHLNPHEIFPSFILNPCLGNVLKLDSNKTLWKYWTAILLLRSTITLMKNPDAGRGLVKGEETSRGWDG